MRQLFVALSVFAVVLASARNAAAQTDDCSLPDTSTIERLIADAFLTADNPTPATIRIVNISYVCQMSGMFRDTYRGISLLAKYECGGSGSCPVEGVVEKSQFDFSCLNGVWIAQVVGSADFLFTRTPNSTFDTPLRTDCSLCISPRQLESLESPLVSDDLTHCVACAECNVGAMKCFGTGVDRCCNFYNPSDGRCLQECQADRLVTDDFDCTAFARFTMTQYVFSEDQGTGSVMVEGSNGVAVTVSGGPPPSQAFVRISGSDVDVTITSLPATVTFNINDDDAIVEANEVYFLTLTSDDPDVLIQQNTTQIMITDDDRMVIGYAMSDYQFVEGAPMTEAMIRIFGNALQDFMFVFVGENMAETLTATAGFFSPGATLFPPLDNPDNDIALQDDRIFQIGLAAAPGFENVVEFGTNIGSDQTFATANITITDNDTVSVMFDQDIYTVSESGSVTITLSLDRGIDTAFTVIVRPEASPTLLPGTSRSTPTTSFTASFQVSPDVQSFSFQLMPIDDSVPNEPNERFQISISFVSDSRVVADDNPTVIIVDDDALDRDVGFAATSYTFIENESTGTVTVTGPSNFPDSLSVSVVGGPSEQVGVRISGTDVSETLTSFPATISFTINDDKAAVEALERYSLTLIPSDPAISINPATTEILILDDDRMVIGYAMSDYQFVEGAPVTEAMIRIFGDALQDFMFVFVGENMAETLTALAGFFPPGATLFPPLDNPDNDIALQDDRTFQIGLTAAPGFENVAEFGANIGFDQTFTTANVTITDNDNLEISFDEPDRSEIENAAVPLENDITLSLRPTQIPFTIEITHSTITDAENRFDLTEFLDTDFTDIVHANPDTLDFIAFSYMLEIPAMTESITLRNVSILDDNINEAEEVFIVIVRLVGVAESTACFQQQSGGKCMGNAGGIIIRIRDNDPMFIGFGTRNTTIFENQFPSQDSFPQPFNVISFRRSELTHTMIFSVTGQRTAEVVAENQAFLPEFPNFDAFFGLHSEENPSDPPFVEVDLTEGLLMLEQDLQVLIHNDVSAEETEFFTLRITARDVGRGVFECYDDTEVPVLGNFLCSHTFYIVDTDVPLNVSFVETVYEVVEHDGRVKVCVNLTQPDIDILESSVNVEVFVDDNSIYIPRNVNTATGRLPPPFLPEPSPPFNEDYPQQLLGFNDLRTIQILETRRTICYNQTVYDDVRLETDEWTGLTLIIGTSTANTVTGIDHTAIRIIDDDVARVGIDSTFYQVNEDVGFVEICAVVFDPMINCPIEFDFSVSLSTCDGSAVGTMDYGEVEIILMFRACETRVCTNVTIVDDNVAELTERFSVELNRTNGLDPRIVLDPVVSEVEIMDDDDGIMCPALLDPINGAVTWTSLTVGGVATYVCDDGFELEGSMTRTCESSGMWSGEEPMCRVAPLDCSANGVADVVIDCVALEPQTTLQCSFNGGPLHSCSLPLVLTNDVSPPGNHSVRIVASTGPEATVLFFIDSNAVPTVSAQVPPVGVYLINGSPRVTDNSVQAEFLLTRPVYGVRCFLRSKFDRIWQDCTSGRVVFSQLNPGLYVLKIHAYNRKADMTTVKRGFVVTSDPNFCSLVLVNRGVTMSASGARAEVEVNVHGPAEQLSCVLDEGETFSCDSPVMLSGLIQGRHKLEITPHGCAGGSKTLSVRFSS